MNGRSFIRRNDMKRFLIIHFTTVTLLLSASLRAQMPQTISYQGLLTSSSGAPLNGTFNLKFELFNVASGGSALWSELDSNVSVSHGSFNVILGSASSLAGIDFNQQLYVQVTKGTDPPFTPRAALTSTPSALAPWSPNGNNISYSSGNVGIGTTAPNFKLDVSGIINATDVYKNGAPFNSASQWISSGSNIYYNAGNVGIGTTTPLSQLHVRGNTPVRILGDLSTLAHGEYVDFMARSSPYSTDIGGLRIQRDSTTGNVNTMIYAAQYGFSASEKMRIAGNGNVGIGTPNPTSKLEIAAQDGLAITGYQPFLTLRDANAGNWRAVIQSVSGGINFLSQHYLDATDLYSYVSTDMWGDVGIRTNPAGYYSLHVAPSGGFYTAYLEGSIPDGICLYANNQAAPNYSGQTNTAIEGDAEDANNNWAIYGHANGGTNNYGGYFEGDVVYTGSLIHSSDEKFKKNIQPCTGALAGVLALTPRTYDYRKGPQFDRFSFSPGKHYGFIAQELVKVFPELVVTAVQPPARDSKGQITSKPVEYKAVKTEELIPILAGAIQEQQKLIEELQQKVAQLEKK